MKKLLLSVVVFVLVTATIFYLMRTIYSSNSYQADSYSSTK